MQQVRRDHAYVEAPAMAERGDNRPRQCGELSWSPGRIGTDIRVRHAKIQGPLCAVALPAHLAKGNKKEHPKNYTIGEGDMYFDFFLTLDPKNHKTTTSTINMAQALRLPAWPRCI